MNLATMLRHFGKMPPLRHWPDRSKPFRLKDSEVVRWIFQQGPFLDYLINAMRQRKVIVFNKETNLTQGVLYGVGEKAPPAATGSLDPSNVDMPPLAPEAPLVSEDAAPAPQDTHPRAGIRAGAGRAGTTKD